MDCRHLGDVRHKVTRPGNPPEVFDIHHCHRLNQICTPHDRGVKAKGEPIPVCAACSLRELLLPVVDVIVTVHNDQRFLAEALDSIRTVGNVFVVDDASDDPAEIEAICAGRKLKLIRVEHRSPHLARGAGFALVTSPLVCFLDCDNRLEPGYLESAEDLFTANPRLAIAYPDLQHFGDDDELHKMPDVFDMSRLERLNFIDTGSVWRREAIEQVNGFAADPTGWEDWYLARSIMRSGRWEAVKNPVHLNYRKHDTQRMKHRADKSYYSTAGLEDETVTVFLTVSGRSHKNHGYFQRHKRWLLEQSWPREQIRVLIANTSHRPLPPEWLAGFDGFAGVSWYDHPVGKPCLEDENRANSPLTELEVQTVVAAINNRMLREIQTEFVLSLENDVFPDPLDAIERLLRGFDNPNVAAVTGAYRQRYEPQAWTVWGSMPANGRPLLPAESGRGVQPIYGSGFGCLMLRASQVKDEVITGRTAVSGYYDADWFDRLQKRGRQVRCNWDVRCEHGGIGVKLTVLLPTVGRDTLKRSVESIKRQLRDGDELWILADGFAGEATWELAGGPVKLIDIEGGPHNDWGHTPRNKTLPKIRSGYVVHFDDDDTMADDALNQVRQAIARHNGDMFLFQMRREDGTIIPVGEELKRGNVGTPMFVHPANISVGVFESIYGGDFDFIAGTVAANPSCQPRWVPHVICNIRHDRHVPVVAKPSQPVAEIIPNYAEPVGDKLHEILTECGIKRPVCGECAKWRRNMNEWGVDGCEQNKEAILNRLRQEAGASSWIEKIKVAGHGYLSVESILTEAVRRVRALSLQP